MLFIIFIFCICELRGGKHRGQPREQKTDGVIIYKDQIDNIKKNHCEGPYLYSKDHNLRTTQIFPMWSVNLEFTESIPLPREISYHYFMQIQRQIG